MSTRCTTHFKYGERTAAVVFRHTDGYPSGAGVDLRKFLVECKALEDSRLSDPSMLAARYVVYLADMFREHGASRLNFLSVRVMMDDSGDAQYRYVIDCAKIDADGLPELTCLSVYDDHKEVAIPKAVAL
jgi:hypothetical protein